MRGQGGTCGQSSLEAARTWSTPRAEQRQRGVSEASGAVSTRGDEATRSGLLHAPAQGTATGSALHPRALFTGRSSDPQRVWRRGL